MRTFIAAAALLALTGCNREPMPPEQVAAAVQKCKALDLKPETFIYAWDGTIARVQCVPKR